jgi:hypothetical protein
MFSFHTDLRTSQLHFKIPLSSPSVTPHLFGSMLLTFYEFEVTKLSSFIPLWSQNIHDMVFIILNVSRFGLGPFIWSPR